MKKTLLLLLMLWVMTSVSLYACDYCLLTQGISPLETANGIGFRLDQRYARLSTLYDEGNRVDNPGALETHLTTQLSGFYSLNARITLLAVVPVVRRFGEVPAELEELEHGGDSEGSSFGLSDISLLGRYQFINRHSLTSTFIAAVQAGLRFPTGKTDVRHDDGDFLEAHLQPGTGAFVGMLGLSLSYAVKRFSLITNSVFGFPGEGEVGNISYQFGNSINYDGAIRWRLNSSLQSPWTVFAGLGVAGEYRGKEIQGGQVLDDTGGHTLYLAPSLQLSRQPFTFEISFWGAVAQDLNGRQLGDTFKTFAGITWLIK